MPILRRNPTQADRLAIWLDESCPLVLAIVPEPQTTLLTMAYGGTPPRVMARTAAHLGQAGSSLRVTTHRRSDLLDERKLRETALANTQRALGRDRTHQGTDTWAPRGIPIDGRDTEFSI